MSKNAIYGTVTIPQVRELLGDKFRFAELSFYIDKNASLSKRQYTELRELGWEQEGFNCWVWRGKSP